LGGSVHTTRKNKNASVFASKEIGLEVNAGETKYVVYLIICCADRKKIQGYGIPIPCNSSEILIETAK
jgi:hypothetical protein